MESNEPTATTLMQLALEAGYIEPGEEAQRPLLPAYTEPGGNLTVYCEHCRAWHRHGAEGGHRVAHCHRPGSPYDRGGYFLIPVGPLTAAVKARHRVRRAR